MHSVENAVSKSVRVSVVLTNDETTVIYSEYLSGLDRINALFTLIDAMRVEAAQIVSTMMAEGQLAA